MAFKLRRSKYKHVFANQPKRDAIYDGISLTKSAWDSNWIDVNPLFIAVAWQVSGGGAVGILNSNNPRKFAKCPLVTGHKAPILDLQWNPFHDNVLATVSEDCYGNIWSLPNQPFPEDDESHFNEPAQVLSGHRRKVGAVAWNPVAENVLATASQDYNVKVWDVRTGDAKLTVGGHTNIIQSVAWNYNGSLLCTHAKDKLTRVVDPRQQEVVAKVQTCEGVKGARAIWMGKTDRIFVVGFGKGSERGYYIVDAKKMDEPLLYCNLDNSAGQLIPFYDEDSDLLWLCGKGDGNIRYYEVEHASEDVKKMVWPCATQYSSSEPLSAAGFMPKRGCDVNTNEIAKLYKATGTKIEVLSFQVPRRSELFADDIFPDCRSDEPALTAEQWWAGENKDPLLKSLEGGFVAKADTGVTFEKKEVVEISDAEKIRAYDELVARVAYLEAELAKFKP